MSKRRPTSQSAACDLFAAPPASPLDAPEPVPEPEIVPELPLGLRLEREFGLCIERILHPDKRRLVTRELTPSGSMYWAWERRADCRYGIGLDTETWGRIDTRLPLGTLACRAAIEHQLQCQTEARTLIHELCPETVRGDVPAVGSGVYEGPGYVLVTRDPAQLFADALAAVKRAAQ